MKLMVALIPLALETQDIFVFQPSMDLGVKMNMYFHKKNLNLKKIVNCVLLC